jgi:hypothetical protein
MVEVACMAAGMSKPVLVARVDHRDGTVTTGAAVDGPGCASEK